MSLVPASTPFCLPADARNCIIRWWRRRPALLRLRSVPFDAIFMRLSTSCGSSSSGRSAGWVAGDVYISKSFSGNATCCCRLTSPALAYSAGCIRGDGWRLSGPGLFPSPLCAREESGRPTHFKCLSSVTDSCCCCCCCCRWRCCSHEDVRNQRL